MGTIVVGIDGSEASDAALRWAMGEARVRRAGLRVVHAYQAPNASITEAGLGAAGGMPVPAVFTEDREQVRRAAETQAKNVIEEALRRAGAESANGLQIDRAPVEGPAAKSLIESAKGADLLVIGSHGHGGLHALLLGSVSHRCAENPPCPVVITPCP